MIISFFWQILGFGIVTVAFVDVYLTVLYPRTGKSVISLKFSKLLWEWYFKATNILQHSDIETVLDREAGADDYIAERNRWNNQVLAFAKYMDFSWGEIAPAERKR